MTSTLVLLDRIRRHVLVIQMGSISEEQEPEGLSGLEADDGDDEAKVLVSIKKYNHTRRIPGNENVDKVVHAESA